MSASPNVRVPCDRPAHCCSSWEPPTWARARVFRCFWLGESTLYPPADDTTHVIFKPGRELPHRLRAWGVSGRFACGCVESIAWGAGTFPPPPWLACGPPASAELLVLPGRCKRGLSFDVAEADGAPA